MPCYHPTEVMIKKKASKTSYPQVVPCGRCIGCRQEQSRQWAVRMMHEARMHTSNLFVTLTYRKETLPYNAALCPEDLQGFIKRLRKAANGPFSFFACGEYGERTQRPHYHALLFGVKFLDMYAGADVTRPQICRSPDLDTIWNRGRTEIGTVTMASASYVAGYIRKKVRAERYERANPLTGEIMTPEFARMSLRPAIGLNWIRKYWTDVYPKDFVVVDGHEAKPPRYYDKWMDREDNKGGTPERRNMMETVRATRFDENEEMTTYQMMSAEKIQQARINLFQSRDAL